MLSSMLPHLFSLGRKINANWDAMPEETRSRVDMFVRETAKILPLPAQFDNVKGLLVDGGGSLPERLVGVFLDPHVRGLIMGATPVNRLDNVDPQTGVVKCRSCGFMQELEFDSNAD